MSDNINHMLSKAKITRHMVKSYNINNLLDIVNKNVNIPSENSLKVGAFVRTVVFDRDCILVRINILLLLLLNQ